MHIDSRVALAEDMPRTRPSRRARTRRAPLRAWLAAAALALAGCGASPPENPLLWRIERQPPAFLFGTIHLGDPRVTVLHPAVRTALDGSQRVLGELDLDDAAKAAIQRDMLLPSGTLKDVLPAPVWQKLLRFLRDGGHAIAGIERMKPWVVATSIVMLDGLERWAGEPALDEVLLARAREAGKQVAGIETLAEQLAVFETLTADEQVALLDATLDLLAHMKATGRNYVAELIDAWLSGDTDRLLAFAEDTTGFEKHEELRKRFMKALLFDRNHRMAERTDAALRAHLDDGFFFAFGALHMPGDEGVVALLRQKGWKVERVPGRDG